MILRTTWEARAKWFYVGLELGIKLEVLHVIEMNNHSMIADCFKEMLVQWLKIARPVPTLAAFANAFRSPTVGFGHLAKEILSSGMSPSIHYNGSISSCYLYSATKQKSKTFLKLYKQASKWPLQSFL